MFGGGFVVGLELAARDRDLGRRQSADQSWRAARASTSSSRVGRSSYNGNAPHDLLHNGMPCVCNFAVVESMILCPDTLNVPDLRDMALLWPWLTCVYSVGERREIWDAGE